MQRRLSTLLVITALALPLLGQEGQLRTKRMSKAELAVFLHDLAHDIPSWRARVNQSRDRLDTAYQWDAMVLRQLNELDESMSHIQDELKRGSGETIAGDVVLVTELETLGGYLNSLSSLLSDAPQEFSSPAMGRMAMLWAHSVNDVLKEVYSSSERFYAHTLATATAADVALESGCGGVFAGRQRPR